MAWATQPFDIQGLGVVGVVHLAFSTAAGLTWLLGQKTTALINIGVTATNVLPALIFGKWVSLPPLSHVLVSVFTAVSGALSMRFTATATRLFCHR